jgi:hypothetical protein
VLLAKISKDHAIGRRGYRAGSAAFLFGGHSGDKCRIRGQLTTGSYLAPA